MKKLIIGLAFVAVITGGTKPNDEVKKTHAETPEMGQKQTLNLYNWEDYIYEPEDGDEEDSVIDQFKAYYLAKYGAEVTIKYDTFATNEEMLTKVVKLNHKYDLICPSDYVIQKLIREDRLEKFDYDRTSERYTSIANYSDNASHILTDLFKDEGWEEYAVGYMWGTMGLIYNPEKVDEIDMETWMSLFDEKYKNKSSIKDAMRETYLIGIISAYRDELIEAKEKYENGTSTKQQYSDTLVEIINRCDEDDINKVEAELKKLTSNVYGLEVDSGKNDITKGVIDINVAWSGDAVYAMDLADEEGVELRYSIPSEGSNIWYDGWVMPKGANKAVAQEFLNFISRPEIAVLNMNYIGYTSFIAGEEVLDNIRENYEVEDGEDTFEVDLSYFFEGTVEQDTEMIVKSDEKNRQFYAQYPDEESVTRCAIMRDFGEKNENVVAMWTRIRSNNSSTWMYIVFGVFVLGVAGYFVYKNMKKNDNKKRKIQKRA